MKVADVIHGKVGLEPAHVATERRGHDASVVDEHVQRAAGRGKPCGERVDGGWLAQLQRMRFGPRHARKRALDRARIASADDHRGPALGKRLRGREPDARVTSGDDDDAAAQVTVAQHVARGREAIEA